MKLCIEADGGPHYSEEGILKDEIRTKKLSDLGIKVLRFSERDVLTNIEGVCEIIRKAIDNTPPHLNPLPLGRGR
jgi:very-short-patch-repair endonuclease